MTVILTVGAGYPPGGPLGGYELSWQSFVHYAQAAGVTCAVLTTGAGHGQPGEHGITRTLHTYKAADNSFTSPGVLGRLAIERENSRALRAAIDEVRPDAIMFWVMGGLSLSLLDTAGRTGLPVVAWVCDMWAEYGLATDPWQRLGRRIGGGVHILARLPGIPSPRVDFAASVSRWLFVSAHLRDRVSRIFPFDMGDASVIPSPVDQAFFLTDERPRTWGGRVLSYGRPTYEKGLDTAVHAMAACSSPMTLLVVGPPGDVDVLALAESLQVGDRVRRLGAVDRPGMAQHLRLADAVVFVGRGDEALGLVPLEAMAAGVPVVTTVPGGVVSYARDGDNCLVVPFDDADAVARALDRLAADADLRDRLVAGGRKTAAGFTDAACNGRALDEVINAHPPRLGRH